MGREVGRGSQRKGRSRSARPRPTGGEHGAIGWWMATSTSKLLSLPLCIGGGEEGAKSVLRNPSSPHDDWSDYNQTANVCIASLICIYF